MSIPAVAALRPLWSAALIVCAVISAAWIIAMPSVGIVFAIAIVVGLIGLCALAALSIVVSALVSRRRQRLFAGGGTFIGLLMFIGLLYLPYDFGSPLAHATDLLTVVMYRNALQSQAAALLKQGISPAVAAVGINGFKSLASGIAYDPTGQIVWQKAKRTADWKAAVAHTQLSVDGMNARHIIGAYYAWFHE